MLIPLSLFVVAVLTALASPRSRGGFLFLLAVLVLLFAGNMDNSDRLAYMTNFSGIPTNDVDPNFEIGYQTLASVCWTLGIPFEGFHFIAALGGLLLCGATIRRFSDRPGLILAMYAAYPFFWDYVQVRNFLAMSVLVFGARYLVGLEKSVLKYLLAVFLAATFHISALFFALMPLACITKPKWFYLIAGAALFAYVFVLDTLIANPLFAFLVHKIETYTVTETSQTTKLGVVAFYAVTVLLTLACGRIIDAARVRGVGGGRSVRTVPVPSPRQARARAQPMDTTVVFRMFLLTGFFLPLATINLDFMRLFRSMFLITCLFFEQALSASRRQGNSTKVMLGLTISLYVGASFFVFVYMLSFSDIISPLFSEHLLSSR